MNIEEYIASGVIETYVLGMASAKEAAEFEMLCDKFPQLRAARLEFELALEQKAFANAVPTPPHLKETILEMIRQEFAVNAAREIISKEPIKAPEKKVSSMRWAIAASVGLLIATTSFIYFLYTKNNELNDRIAQSKETLDQIDAKNRQLERLTIPDNYTIKEVKATLPQQTVPASIKVYWDSTNTHVYLVIRDLEKLPGGQKYQLWSVSGEKRSSLGLFDAPINDDKLILKVNNSQAADAFAISIVKGIPKTETTGGNNLQEQK